MSDFDRFEALSFDCYGTLIDWEAGIREALLIWAGRHDAQFESDELLTAFGSHETAVERERPGLVYPAVLMETLKLIGRKFEVRVTDEDAAEFGSSVGRWPAFPDSAEALARLEKRFQLIVLSNVDRGSFALSEARLGVEFDLVVTAQDVGSYKPDLRNFEALFARLEESGRERERLLHVAQSPYHDHEPAQQLGLPSVWIDRRQGMAGYGATPPPESGATRPQWRYPSLTAFADSALGEAKRNSIASKSSVHDPY